MSGPDDAVAPYDVVVLGAGPAGLAAATTAADHHLRVAVVDAGARPGGQYWRNSGDNASMPEVDGAPRPHRSARRPDQFTALQRRLRDHVAAGAVTYLASTTAWWVEIRDDGVALHVMEGAAERDGGQRGRTITGRRLVVATGGYDRQLPFPGWDLPGVMAAGGVQAMLKEHHVAAGKRVVVAGTGPFLLPVATGLADAGARVVAVCEAGDPRAWARSTRAVAGAPGKVLEGARHATAMARHRIPYLTRRVVTRAVGRTSLQGVETARLDAAGAVVPGSRRALDADLLAVGWGFTPQLEVPLALGCATHLDVDGSLVVSVDAEQRSDVPGVYAAGESTGVGGSALAVIEGELAALCAAGDAGVASRAVHSTERRTAALRRRAIRLRAFAAAMHRAHPVPARWPDLLEGSTTLCRCEEVSCAAAQHALTDLGATSARSVKLLTRTGMGWCQGRVCGYAVSDLTARACGRPLAADDLAAMGSRPFAAPVPMGLLACSGAPAPTGATTDTTPHHDTPHHDPRSTPT